jgi:hypothetical protein
MFNIIMILIGVFFGIWGVLFAISNYIVIFGMWMKGMDKPLFGLIGPVCVLLSMWFIVRDVNWWVFLIAATIDPGGIFMVLMSVWYICYGRFRKRE